MSTYPAPNPPYAGPPYRQSGTGNKPINRIVIHSTVGPSKDGSRYGIAAYFRSSRAGGSAHYVVDAGGVLQTGYDSVVCWHAPPNSHSIGIEMCDYPTWDLRRFFGGSIPKGVREVDDEDVRDDLDPGPGVRRVPILPLLSPTYRALLDNTARLTAELALAYDVPVEFKKAAALQRGEHGITTHRQVSLAFHQTTHWDPGAWPRRYFMRRVRFYVKQIKKEMAS